MKKTNAGKLPVELQFKIDAFAYFARVLGYLDETKDINSLMTKVQNDICEEMKAFLETFREEGHQ